MIDITKNSIVQRHPEVLATSIPSGAVLLDAVGGRYIELNTSSAAIWELLTTPKTVAAICDALLERYDVAPEACEHDVCAALGQLSASGVVQVGP